MCDSPWMGWSIGYDSNWRRDVGYGVPAYCDHPGCGKKIDRGLSYVCGGQPFGGEQGCGLFFCGKHKIPTYWGELCDRCQVGADPHTPTADHEEWTRHKMTDPSWATWRAEHEKQKPPEGGP